MKPEIIAVLCVFVAFSMIEMWRVGLFRKKAAIKGDGLVELISTLTLLLSPSHSLSVRPCFWADVFSAV